MSNILNSGSLDTLKSGQCLLVGSRRVSNGKVQLEFAEVLEGASQSNNNALAAFNASDDRFSATKARRAWMTAEPVDASELLGVDLTGGYSTNEMGREVKSLNVINPEALGKALRVQITETVEPTEWQMENLETAAKRRGKDGDYITHKGMYIFANTNVVFGEPKHTFLEADAPATAGGGIIASQSVDVATGEILS
tara:strand:- start:246 stop:833 length:588 start_codon:yes stop_codon:yes gene_type:complete